MAEATTIKCSFSMLDEGRTYTGHHRKYIIENAREVCYSAPTRERIRLREAFGYYGHGRRILSGKMNIQEVEAISLPGGGEAIISNIPSNVTTTFEVDENGTVTHEQEILNTDTGRIVSGLHASRVGGFSWACPGSDGGRNKPTQLYGFSGFDYVLSPGFARNRGYVLESAGTDLRQLVMESVSAVVHDDNTAERIVEGWMNHGAELDEMQARCFELERGMAELASEKAALEAIARETADKAQNALSERDKALQQVTGVLESLRDNLPIFIPDSAMHSMLNGDFDRAKRIFESAARIDFRQLPIRQPAGGNTGNPSAQPSAPVQHEVDFGSAAYGECMAGEHGASPFKKW